MEWATQLPNEESEEASGPASLKQKPAHVREHKGEKSGFPQQEVRDRFIIWPPEGSLPNLSFSIASHGRQGKGVD